MAEQLYIQGSSKLALLDFDDYLRAIKYKWSISNGRSICARVGGKTVNLGRFVLGTLKCECVDHIDGNVFNNQKSNLREATTQQNSFNKAASINSLTQIKGVHWDKSRGRFVASARIDGVKKLIGRFFTVEEATLAYKKATEKLHGDFANVR